MGRFGLALGLGFQFRDDLLGIWGRRRRQSSADDIRRRKQSLPILILRERLDEPEPRSSSRLFPAPKVDGAGVARVLALLEREGCAKIEAVIASYHDQAAAALIGAAQPGQQPSARPLADPAGAAFDSVPVESTDSSKTGRARAILPPSRSRICRLRHSNDRSSWRPGLILAPLPI